MSDENPIPQALPAAHIKPKRGISVIWLLPLFAVLLGGWLAYKHFSEAGVNITVTFPTGEGISAGKTEVRYKGIKIGTVDELNVQPNLHSVAAQITMSKQTKRALREDTQFWLVKPELSLAGVEGLDTLVSGNYIAMQPGESERKKYSFKALEKAPPPIPEKGDLQISLSAADVGSLHRGSPIHYHKLQVGQIVDYHLSKDKNHVILNAQINAKYASLVHKNSRFWNTSGISISGNLNSISVNTDSLAAIILGGISFATPPGESPKKPASNNDVFNLYPTFTQAKAGIKIAIEFPSAKDISANHTKILYKGMDVGKITGIRMKPDYSSVIATASIDPQAKVLLNQSTQFWIAQPQISLSKISGLSTLLSGSHIEMDFTSNKRHRNERAPKDTAEKRHFIAQTHAPSPSKDKPGLYIQLTAQSLQGITRSSEIYYRNISIGQVVDYRLGKDDNNVMITAHIQPKFTPLIQPKARFYQVSGININASLQGVKINTESLATVVKGGIALYLPNNSNHAKKVTKNTRFKLYRSLKEAKKYGKTISISFNSSKGLKAGADIRYLGVNIGTIERVRVNYPQPGVTVEARLKKGKKQFSQAGSQFWQVTPEVSIDKVAHLQTAIFGTYIATTPGTKAQQEHYFIGRESAPKKHLNKKGLNLTLEAPSLDSIKTGRAVFYRQIPVGEVTSVKLASNAMHVNINIHINPYYAPLVKNNSVFWSATGIDFDFSLFSGAKLKTGSAQSLLSGGIAFATPDKPGAAATSGQHFILHDSPKDKWKNWAPKIVLTKQKNDHSESSSNRAVH